MLLCELRKNPEQNPRLSPLDELQAIANKHKKDVNNIFVTFTDVDKLGANPQSPYDTPLGICSYPIKYVIRKKMDVPYQAATPFIQVFKIADSSNIWNLSKDKQVDEIVQKLPQIFNKKASPINTAKQAYKAIQDYCNRTVFDTYNGREVGVLFRKILTGVGITGILDNGKGIIYRTEKNQAIFFTTRILKHISTVDNSTFERRLNHDLIMQAFHAPESITPAHALHILNVTKRRNKRLENIVAQDIDVAVRYASEVIHTRWPKIEPRLLQSEDLDLIIFYATHAIKGRWPEAEPIIAKLPESALYYAKKVIKGQWPLGEPTIFSDNNYARLYKEFLRTLDITQGK
jgi:hypothetical protein